MKKPTIEWLKAARDDLDVIRELIDKPHLTHMVAFHVEQAIEKSLKALLEEDEIETPKIHSLTRLMNLLKREIKITNHDLLKILDQLYLDARYPGELGLLPYGKPTLEDANEFYRFAVEIFEEACNLLKINMNMLDNRD